MKYKCVTMDPPWLERGGGKCKRGADRHYPFARGERSGWDVWGNEAT